MPPRAPATPLRPLRRPARAAALVALLAALLLGGCAERGSDGPFADLTAADRERSTAFSQQAQDLSIGFARLLAAASAERFTPARRSLGALDADLAEARDSVAQLQSGVLRARMTTYLDTYDELLNAADRWLAYYETLGHQNKAAEARLDGALEDSVRAMERQDRALVRTLLEATPEEERPALQRRIDAYERRLARASGAVG